MPGDGHLDDGPVARDHAARTIRLDLAYEGTDYHGFGIQPGAITIQEVIESTLARILSERIRVSPAGRTDAGVHAAGQVLSFRTRSHMPPEELLGALNACLPDDMCVVAVSEMPADFDARRRAVRRHYRYLIWNAPRRHFWWRRWSWHVADPLDPLAMDEATSILPGTHDFSAFAGKAARERAGRVPVRTVEHARWTRRGGFLAFDISADSFLRHMVRCLVGTLVWVGQGRLTPAQFRQILESRDRRQAGPNAPAHGLMLMRVDYPERFEIGAGPPQGAMVAMACQAMPAAPTGEC